MRVRLYNWFGQAAEMELAFAALGLVSLGLKVNLGQPGRGMSGKGALL
jgi:hypothetical protein